MSANQSPILTPVQVGQYIKAMMEHDRTLSGLMVRGEVSNYKLYPSGHHYFTLKDREGALRCVMFRGDALALRFRPENGMQVIAEGRVTAYPRDGQYQLYCQRLTPDGAGDLHLAFEQLKQRLGGEGLFERERKRPLPRFPERIGLITSPAGAAVRDLLRILASRWPMARVCILPVRVQGEGAAEEIAAAIHWANQHRVAQLLITGRGGGSMEDLWAFNEEVVARAIYHSTIPVISAVGHEPDVTIADFVADLRAATPSNGAELAVPDQQEIYQALHHTKQRLTHGLHSRLTHCQRELRRLGQAQVLREPGTFFREKHLVLDDQQRQLSNALTRCLSLKQQRFTRLAATLDAMSPLRVLGRGYSIAQNQSGTVISSAHQAQSGELITLRLSEGRLHCMVKEKG